MRGLFCGFDRVGSILRLMAVAACAVPSAAPANAVVLSPQSPPLDAIGVPYLHEVLPEHRLSGSGLVLEPAAGPYEWTKTGPTDEPFVLNLAVESPVFQRGTLTVWNWNNHAVAQFQVPAGEPKRIALQVDGLGAYLLTFDGWRADKVEARLIRNLGVTRDLNRARETWRTEEFFIGTCAFPGRYHWKPGGEPTLPAGLTEPQARDREAELIARLGLQVVRTDESLEMGKRKGKEGGEEYFFDFSRMDAAVGSYTSRGFQIVLQTMSASDWAVLPHYADRGKDRWRYPHQEKPQRAYLAALVGRYGKHARFVQVSNEPDQTGYWSGTNDEFVTQYRFSRDEIRRVAPEIPVTVGGYTLVDEAKCAFFIKHLRGQTDLPAYNAHGNLEDYARSFATLRRLQSEAGDTATGWVNTEAGYSAWRLEQERRQAQIDAQKVLYSWANGHKGILLFCSRMTRGPGRDGPPDFGLLDYQYGPRFAYGALATLTGTLTNTSYAETLSETNGIYLYRFHREGESILAGFTLREEPVTVRITSDARERIPIDEMGNAAPAEAGGDFPFLLDGYPRYQVLRGATKAGVE
jgi:hypothetical protein